MLNLLAIVIALLFDSFVRLNPNFRRSLWVNRLQGLLAFLPAWPNVLLALFIPLVLLGYLQYLSHEQMLIKLGLDLLVLWYALGPYNFYQQAKGFIQAKRLDDGSEDAKANIREQQLALSGKTPSSEPGQIAAGLNAVMVRANDNLFAFIFWYLIGGATAALALRLLIALYRRSENRVKTVAETLLGLMLYVPARMVALSFAVMGSFDDALQAIRQHRRIKQYSVLINNEAFLRAVGRGALREDLVEEKAVGIERVEAATSLVLRCLFLWLALLAIASLMGWIA